MDNVEKLIFSLKKRTARHHIIKFVMDFGILFFSASLLNYLSDYAGYPSFAVRLTILIIFISLSGFFLFTAARRLLALKNADEEIAGAMQKNNPQLKDDLLNAVQLKENVIEGTSRELAAAFIDAVSAALPSAALKKPGFFRPLRARLASLAVLGVLFGLFFNMFSFKRYFFPFGGVSFSLSPKNTSVVSGGSVNISVLLKEGSGYPYLNYRHTAGAWNVLRMTNNGEKKYSARLNGITDDIEYYARLSDMRSLKYKISVVPPTTVAVIKLEYIYPSYTGLAGRVSDSPDIEAPAGTMVKITASSNKKISEAALVTDTGEKIKMAVSGPELSARFAVQNQSEYWIEATSLDGYTDPQPVRYSISIQPNAPPEIEILSPANDVVVSEKGRLKILYSGKDDFGVKRVDFNCLTMGIKFDIKKYGAGQRKILDEYELKIEDLGLRAGDAVQYRLEASDDEIAAERNTGISKTYTLEVFSYDMEHKKIEDGLADFRKNMLDILARELENRQMTGNNETSRSAQAQKEIKEITERELKNIEKIIERMKDDPLTTFSIYSEYKNLKESLEYLKNEKMTAAADMLAKNRPEEGGKIQDGIISELERLSTLADNIFERQKMEDVVSSARDMRDSSLELRDQIEALKNAPSKEQAEKLAKAAEKISELMRQLSEKLSKMPQDLPDEFINSQSVKNIDFADMGKSADALKNALDSGNFEAAIKAAEQLAAKISQMLKTFDEMAKNVADNSADKLKQQTMEAIGELNGIIEKQQELLDETEKINGDYKKRVLELQKELLKKLAVKQAAAMQELNLSGDELSKSKNSYRAAESLYNSANGKMNNLLAEFSSGKIDKAKTLLGETVSALSEAKRQIEPAVKIGTEALATAELRSLEHLEKSKKIEEEILSEFANFSPPPQDVLDESQLSSLEKQAAKQQGIQKDTAGLGKKLYGLSGKTSAISKQMLDDITDSQSAMGTAQKELLGRNAPPAVEAERDALQHLLKSKDSLDNSGSQLDQMAKGGRAPGGGPAVRMRSGGSSDGGSSGFMTGFVKIPALDDYKPPKEFREEVMDALRRKYPEEYEKTIKDYYKRLIE